MQAVFGILAVVLNLLGYIPYIRDIVAHKVKPQRVTWGLWTILTTITFANQVLNGGGWSAWFFGTTTLLVTLTFILSIRRGVGGGSLFDMVLLGSAGLLFLYWLTVHNTHLSTIIAVVIDAIGLIPTVLKTRKRPNTESYPQWVLAAIAGIFTLLAVARFEFILILYPAYVIVGNSIIVGTKYYAENYETAK